MYDEDFDPDLGHDPAYVSLDVGLAVGDNAVSYETLLKKQIQIASALQEQICKPGQTLEVKELKDLIAASSSLVTAAHRGGEALKSLETYRVFVSVVIEFLRRRSDTLGEDLVEELKTVAQELRAEETIRPLLQPV